MATINQNRQLMSLETPLGDDKLIPFSFEGKEEVSEPFCYQLRCFSQTMNIQEKDIVGKNITFQINDEINKPRYFNGIVKKLSKKDLSLRKIRDYEIEIVPWFWLLTLSSDCRIFQNKTSVEIIESVFKSLNQHNFDISFLSKSYDKRDYCVQYNESAFSFVSRLMEEEGIFYFFRHEKGKHTLVLADLVSKCPTNPTKEAEYYQGSLRKNHLSQWTHHYALCSGKFTQTDYDFIKPQVNLLTTTKSTVPFSEIDNYEIFEFPGLYTEKSSGQSISRTRIEEQEQGYDIATGKGGYSQFSPGTRFHLKTHECSSEQAEYFLTAVYHSAKDISHMVHLNGDEKVKESQDYSNEFSCIPSSAPYRPKRTIPKPKIQGVQPAIVVGPSGEEIYTDKYGRIKVQFLWDRQGKKDENSSCWLRVSHPWAGSQWGHVYIPRIGQEVMVDFMEGNPDRPIVVGCLYNNDNMSPYPLPENKTQSGIKSRSTPKGSASQSNEIRFEDKKDQEEVFIHAQKDLNKIVENDESINIKHDQTLTVKNNRTHTIEDGDDTLLLKKGSRSVTIQTGNAEVTVSQGNRKTKISMGNDTLEIAQGNHTITLSLGKSTIQAMQGIELKVGQNSLKVDQTGVAIQGLMIKINGKLIQVEADALLQLKGAITMIN